MHKISSYMGAILHSSSAFEKVGTVCSTVTHLHTYYNITILQFQLTHRINHSHKNVKIFLRAPCVLWLRVLRFYTMHGTRKFKIVNAQQTTLKAPWGWHPWSAETRRRRICASFMDIFQVHVRLVVYIFYSVHGTHNIKRAFLIPEGSMCHHDLHLTPPPQPSLSQQIQ